MGIYVYVVCVYVNKYCESNVLRAQMCFSHWLWWQEFSPFIMSCDMFYLLVVEIAPNCMIYTCICKYICIYKRIFLNIIFIGQHSLLSTVTVLRADILSVWTVIWHICQAFWLKKKIQFCMIYFFAFLDLFMQLVLLKIKPIISYVIGIPYFKMYYWYRLYQIF